jgi:deoxycytidylate deaminase
MSFRIAEIQARKSKHSQHKLGAVIVKGHRILATGFNSMRSSAVTKTPTLHAEAAAILHLLKERRLEDLAGAEMYVTRFTRGGNVGCSKPCANCMSLIRSVGIKLVHYNTETSTSTLKV